MINREMIKKKAKENGFEFVENNHGVFLEKGDKKITFSEEEILEIALRYYDSMSTTQFKILEQFKEIGIKGYVNNLGQNSAKKNTTVSLINNEKKSDKKRNI